MFTECEVPVLQYLHSASKVPAALEQSRVWRKRESTLIEGNSTARKYSRVSSSVSKYSHTRHTARFSRETGNPFAQTLVTKHEEVTTIKNGGFKKCVEKIRGTNVISPAEINIYRFAPCTSVPVERLFSVLKNFIADRHNILRETLHKLIFVKYNKDQNNMFAENGTFCAENEKFLPNSAPKTAIFVPKKNVPALNAQ